MPQLPFKQKILANKIGELIFNEEITLPFKATLKELVVQVGSNCSDRLHPCCFQLFKGNGIIVDLPREQIADCTAYAFPKRGLSLDKGDYRASVISTGFQPSEEVSIEGILKFAFGSSIAEIKGFEEIQISLHEIQYD